MKYIKYITLVLLLTINSFAKVDFTQDEINWIKNNPTVELGADFRWPPFDFTDEDNKHTGLSSEYIKLISEKSGLKFNIHTDVWSKVLTDMKAKKYDGLTCAVETNERVKYLKFTTPYLTIPSVLVVKNENTDIKIMSDLDGKSISVNKDSYTHEWIKTSYPKIKLNFSKSSKDSLEDVSTGKVDAYVGNLAVATYMKNKYLLNNLKVINIINGLDTRVSIAIDKDKKTLFGIMEKTLKNITFQEHIKLREKWSLSFKKDSTKLTFTEKQKEWIKNNKTIKYVIDNNWNPIEYLSNKSGLHHGISSDYIDIISKKTGISFEILKTDNWSQSVSKINNREADMYSCVTETPSRKKVINFSNVYLDIPQVFITKKSVGFIANMESLYDKKLALIKDYYILEIIKKEHPEIEIIEVQNINEALKKLTNGEAYAYIGILPAASYYMQEGGYGNLKISGLSGYKSELRMALRNNLDKEGIEVINKALASISEVEKNNIYNKWSNITYTKEIDYTLLFEISGFLILLIIASFFWNRKLSAEIIKKNIVQKKLENSIQEVESKNARIFRILKMSDNQSKELAEFNKKLENSTKIAQSANKAKTDFLSNMSHEIRTPMNAILGFAELLDDRVEDKKSKSFIKTIRSAGQTLLFLINDILDLSKIESGKLKLVKTKTNIKNLLNETVAIFQLQAEQKDITIEFSIENKAPDALLVDAVRLKEILMNLIGNALKFTENGYIKLSVIINAVYEHTSKLDLTIIVKDTGIGIDKSDLGKIFNTFEQSDNQDIKKYGGTGLGLAISRKLAHLMGGTLSVKSELGKGSSFVLNLNGIDIASLNDAEDVYMETDISYSSIIFKEGTILVVDDIAENRDLIKESFSETNIKIIEAENGEKAIEVAKNEKIDLIIMDIRMPIMDGYTATKLIKKFSSVHIIALTASIMQDELNKLDGKKFDGYLRKPVSKNELFKEISKFLEYKQDDLNIVVEDEVNIENIEDLKMFLSDIEGETQALFTNLQQTNDINAITDFTNLLLSISSKYNISYMINYSNFLLEKIDAFEIDAMGNMLNKYEDIVKNLKSKTI